MVKKVTGVKMPAAAGPPMPMPGFTQRGGKMKAAGLMKKAKKVAEEVPTGPMKGLK